MSKFVTYPAVTVLDDDQSLLIDSPSAGTNSITAENAADTLLSKWSGFDTFDEAVQNTISNNQEFIDRDTAIRSEITELKKKIVTTFPAKEASGAVATFESEFEDAPLKSCIVQIEPVQDLHGYDSPWPAGGGKNILPYASKDTDTKNGVTWTKNSDGSITFSGTCSVATALAFVEFKLPAGDYLFSNVGSTFAYTGGYRPIVYIRDLDNALSLVNIGFGQSTNGFSFSLSAETNIRFYAVFQDDNVVSGVLYPMIRLASEADASYAPYSNECPITGWTGVEVHRTGKNLFTRNGEVENSYVGKEGNIGTGSGWILSDFIPVKGSTQYHFNPNSSEGYSAKHCCYNSQKQHIGYFDSGDVTFTTQADCAFMRFSYRSTSENIQLELGSTATDYEPYTGQTYPITFPTSAGTVYGGYVDVINGELVVDRTEVVFDGSNDETFNKGTSGMSFRCYLPNNAKLSQASTVLTGTSSNQLREVTQSAEWGINGTFSRVFSIPGRDYAVYFKIDDEITTVNQVRDYLAENPLTFVYELAEPIRYPLAPQEIKTLLGDNNLWADTGDTAVEYLMSDVSWYVKKKLRAFQSVLAGVEESAVASKNYSTDSYLIFNDDIYRVTKTITAGETIEDGVNVTKTTVAEQLMALAQA